MPALKKCHACCVVQDEAFSIKGQIEARPSQRVNATAKKSAARSLASLSSSFPPIPDPVVEVRGFV